MMHARRWKLSAAQRADMWSRWKAGQSLREIGRHSQVATLVERHSRFCMLVKVPGKDTATVVAGLSQQVRQSTATKNVGISNSGG